MREATTMKATTIGIDLAKHLFQLHGVDQHGKTVLKRQLKRDQMLSFFSYLPPREGANKWIAPSPRTLCPHLKCPSLQKPDFFRKHSAIKRHLAPFSRLISIFGHSYPMPVSSGPRETDSPT
ncbi:hypothetical protein CF104_18215 [Aeromonas jandaei]|nr:hypothetical protein CF104_18215 [Aeromonas jandaei]